MADATRITVRKQDEATVVAEQLIDADTDTIIFSIPKGALFSQSLNNFKLLKREGSVLGKEIIIESEDPLVQERAVKAGLELGETPAANEDAQEPEEEEEVRSRAGMKLPRGRSLRVKESAADEEPVKHIARGGAKKKAPIIEAEQVIDADIEDFAEEDSRGEPVRPARKNSQFFSRKRMAVLVAAAVGIVGVVALMLFVLPSARIIVEIKKQQWSYNESVIVDKAISKIDISAGKIPGQVFTQKSVTNSKLPASGAQFFERKATGVLTVYNAYSSQPQSIVATTRFVTPDGVVFRTTKALVIPGAKIENGNIIPSTITVPVVADKVGPASNVGTIARLTIPGFAKSPKFDGFYGELRDGTSGGFSGKTKVATEADIKSAKAQGLAAAQQLVQSQIAGQIPSGFKVVEGSERFLVTKQTVDEVADTDGNFTVTTEAQLSVFAFQEQDVKDLLAAKMALATAAAGEFKVDSEQLAYSGIATSTNAILGGRLSMPVKYDAMLSHVIDVEGLKTAVAGKPESVLKTFILGTPGVTGGTVNLWPFYVGTVPSRVSKISVELR